MKTLFLVRHGLYQKTDWTRPAGGYAFKDLLLYTDGPLSDGGKEQAQRMATRMSTYKIDRIFCSSLQRTRETAQFLSEALGGMHVNTTDLLWEVIPSMPPHASEEICGLNIGEIEVSRQKADQAFEQYFKPSKNDSQQVLVCHGNLIRYLVCRILEIPFTKWNQMEISNCGITEVTVDSGEMMLVSHNDVGHLPRESQSYR